MPCRSCPCSSKPTPGHEVCAIGLYLASHGIKHDLGCRLLGNHFYAEALSIDGTLFSSLGLHEDWESYRMALLRHHVATLAPAKTPWRGDVVRIDLDQEKQWAWDETARPTMEHAMALLAAWEQERHLEQATGPAPSAGRAPRLEGAMDGDDPSAQRGLYPGGPQGKLLIIFTGLGKTRVCP